MDPSSWIEAGAKVLPSVINLIGSLVAMGKTPDEAAEIVKRDLESRQAAYEAAKAADDAALEAKHGRTPSS